MRWRNGSYRETEWFMLYGQMQKRRNEDSEEWADVGSLLVIWGHGDFWAELDCCQGSCPGPWFYSSQSAC